MNNNQLDKLLKSAPPPPERQPEFWEKFPTRIVTQIHWRAQRAAARNTAAPSWRFRMAWGFAAVAICLVLGPAVISWPERGPKLTARDLATARTYLRELEALFPNQVRAIEFDPAGPRLLLAERPDVSAAQPVLVRVCGRDGCRSFLTFSGQRIRLDGDWLDVLVDSRGQVLLAGEKLAWTSDHSTTRAGAYRIAALPIGTTI